jgi:hypothetical protein
VTATKGLGLFDATIDSYQRAGNHVDLAAVLAELAVFFDRDGQPKTAATLYWTTARYAPIAWVIGLGSALAHLRAALGDTERLAVRPRLLGRRASE